MGLGANVYQDKLYRSEKLFKNIAWFSGILGRRNVAHRGPEIRLYLTCLVAILFPLAMFMFARTASQQFHWIWPINALTASHFSDALSKMVLISWCSRSPCSVPLLPSTWSSSYIWPTGRGSIEVYFRWRRLITPLAMVPMHFLH